MVAKQVRTIMKDERLTQRTFCRLRSPFILYALLITLLTGQAVASQTNINTATKQELTTLPYIGEVKAEAIISYRQNHGPFTTNHDIQNVDGIGEKSYLILNPLISIADTAPPVQPTTTQDKSPITKEKQPPFAQPIRTGQIMILTNQQYLPMLINFIQTAKYRIDIGMYIFKVGKSEANGPRRVMAELIRARKRGVKVNVTLEKSSYNNSLNDDNKQVAKILRRNKITVKLDSKKRTTHTKIVIIDGRFGFIGSHNFTHSALTKNNEITLLLDNPRVVGDISRYLNNIQ